MWETWLNTPEDTVVSSNSTSFLFLLSLPTFQLSEVNSLTPNPAFPSPLRSVSVAKVTVRPGDRNWLSQKQGSVQLQRPSQLISSSSPCIVLLLLPTFRRKGIHRLSQSTWIQLRRAEGVGKVFSLSLLCLCID